ncbi:hypothetical protein PpBr36_01356 [Pyricularia pennisetigena]|uniref:hypothetical protein n=1 Tax=Pyricularia pennisetigena TaxID=1578925 RepID=UPI00114E9385|nr:hypothetical protein PpBr36_01356 [Pyricularia pennisetigena]TLS28530.1 hypothetical protein PpBr36_01356 [Pyricularia pennisetigena]
MGIRNLATNIKPYSQDYVLDSNSRIVIDGPSLAYHIISLCSPRQGATTPFQQPRYDLLADTALAWLQELERHGPTVAAIYFDGHLPRRKLAERLERSTKVSRQLNNFFLSTPHGVSEITPRITSVEAVRLFSPDGRLAASTTSGSGTLPIPSFAVGAIYDALRQSERYGSLTKLVPEEADCYCAESVRLAGGIILTSDSDLLVYDLGEDGSVTLFQDIGVPAAGTTAGSVVGFHTRTYTPAKIANRLGLPKAYGLSALAFEIYMDTHISPGKLLEKSRQSAAIKANPKEYELFMEQYRLSPRDITTAAMLSLEEMKPMDSRTSELVIQSLSPADVSSFEVEDGASDNSNEIAMFLPALVDAWSRTSAWEMSTSVRALAYSVLQLAQDSATKHSQVREYRRLVSAKPSGTLLSLLKGDDFDVSCTRLTEIITKIRSIMTSSDPSLAWAVFGLHEELRCSQEAGKQPLGLHVLTQCTNSDGTIRDTASWDILHFVAQINGLFYSLRMLRQALDFVAGRMPLSSPALKDLSDGLCHIPHITNYCSVHDIKDLPQRLKSTCGLDALKEVADLSKPIAFDDRPKLQGKSKKKRKRTADASGARASPKLASKARNMFSLLDSIGSD